MRARRRERRLIPPFGDGSSPHGIFRLLGSALAKCRFAPFPNRGWVDGETYTLNPLEVNTPLEPRLDIVVDGIEDLTDRLGVSGGDLSVGVSVRSRHLKRYDALEQWRIDALPAEPWSPSPNKLGHLQSGRGIDFIVAIRVSRNSTRLARLGLELGKVLCRREFSIRESVDTSTFPFEWVEFGGDSEYPRELLWAIRWNDSADDEDRFSRPVHEVLTVLVNKRAERSLTDMGAVRSAGDLAWKMLAAEITTQIWSDVLANIEEEPNEDDTETLAGQVFAHLSRASGKPYAEIEGLADQDDSLAELRALIAKILRVVA